MESLEHFPPAEIPSFLKALSNLLNKDGILIITVPSKKLKLQEKHYQHFSPESLSDTLKNNFNISKIYGYSYLGKGRRLYNFLERFGKLIVPFKKFNFAKLYFKNLKKVYNKKFALGNCNNSLGLIAVCRKEN